jgi:hypothetical protein
MKTFPQARTILERESSSLLTSFASGMVRCGPRTREITTLKDFRSYHFPRQEQCYQSWHQSLLTSDHPGQGCCWTEMSISVTTVAPAVVEWSTLKKIFHWNRTLMPILAQGDNKCVMICSYLQRPWRGGGDLFDKGGTWEICIHFHNFGIYALLSYTHV